MQNIIDPIDRNLLKAELTKEKRLRSTNKSSNEIYIEKHEQVEQRDLYHHGTRLA